MKTEVRFRVEPFTPPQDDGLAAEHAAVLKWVEQTVATNADEQYAQSDELNKLIFEAEPKQARRYVLAAMGQVRHWDHLAAQLRMMGATEGIPPGDLAGWHDVWNRRIRAEEVIETLTRRALPFKESDLISLLQWCNSPEQWSTYGTPLINVCRALRRYAEKHELTRGLLGEMRPFASLLRQAYKKARPLATLIEQLCANAGGESIADASQGPGTPARAVQPAPAGNPAVLDQLKRFFRIADAQAPAAATEPIGHDRFALRVDSPLRAEHDVLSAFFDDVSGTRNYHSPELDAAPAGKQILGLDEEGRGRALLAATERSVASLLAPAEYDDPRIWQSRYAAISTVTRLALGDFALDRDGLFDFLLFTATRDANWHGTMRPTTEKLFAQVEQEAARSPLTEGERYVLHLARAAIISGPPLGSQGGTVKRFTDLIADGAKYFVVPGEAWTDAANADIGALPPQRQRQWTDLLRHALTATAARPSAKWLKTAATLDSAVGEQDLADTLARWLPLVNKGRTIPRLGAYHGDTRGAGDVMHEENATALRGLLWIIPTLPQKADLTRAVAATAQSAYRKVPGVGPRAVKVGNAAVYALSEIGTADAVGQLAMLKVRVKFGTAQKEIEKAFTTAANALGLPRDQIEELGVPTYGLEDVGLRRESFGDEFRAELRVAGRDVTLAWSRADGKPQKSVPAKVKSDYKEELKELQTAAKDIAAMLPAQADRIDSMVLQQRRWPVLDWRQRYLDHPLIGTLARRLIWTFTCGDRESSGIWLDGKLVDADDTPLDVNDAADVQLWHPIGRPLDDVLACRAWLERYQVRQPFKQAHREVYLLTDAERRTHTYSNRFAAHVLRQHQFNALCAARGWKNKLRLLVDDSYPPAMRDLPAWGLRAEYWVEGIGTDYGQDTNDSGAFLRISTDQVRFYRTAAATNYAHAGGGGYGSRAADPSDANANEPLPLDQVPPLVLSEVMRDVDLFVGVASVGNDPTWQDGGPGGRYADYWQTYSFGDLTESAKTRRAVLESLLPRLTRLRGRWSLEDRFLVIRGDIRTYKIHLGSGNILMAPNDQYLCIVPNRSADATKDVYLPFEGDSTLSIILSKAFLLAEDTKIDDPTITRQIR